MMGDLANPLLYLVVGVALAAAIPVVIASAPVWLLVLVGVLVLKFLESDDFVEGDE